MRRTELKRKAELVRTGPLERRATTRKGKPALKSGRGFSASRAQQEKVRLAPCAVCGVDALHGAVIDPAHIAPRGGKGGCKDALCVVPLCRVHHDALDGEPYNGFDLLPFVARRYTAELAHALLHYEGNLIGLLERLTGRHWTPDTRSNA